MISALNELRRTMGLPTVPTISGGRRASREMRRQWRTTLGQACYSTTRNTMETARNLAACPDNQLGEPDAELRGRMVRMTDAVVHGFEEGLRRIPE